MKTTLNLRQQFLRLKHSGLPTRTSVSVDAPGLMGGSRETSNSEKETHEEAPRVGEDPRTGPEKDGSRYHTRGRVWGRKGVDEWCVRRGLRDDFPGSL